MVERSPPPPSSSAFDTQLPVPSASQPTASQVVVQPSQQQRQPPQPRRRPGFQNVQELDTALHQAIEGKINVKNAWASKEAGDLLDSIAETVVNTLEASDATQGDYSGFAKVATMVEGCSKVWTSRVDSTFRMSNLMIRRLLRKEKGTGGDDDGDDAEGDDEEGGAGGEEGGEAAAARAARKKQQQQARRPVARTLALDAAEINLDHKAMVALTQTGIHAQFRAITEKFDQSHAQGLLLVNAPLGRAANFIIDVDYSLEPKTRVWSARQKAADLRRQQQQQEEEEDDDDGDDGGDEEEGEQSRHHEESRGSGGSTEDRLRPSTRRSGRDDDEEASPAVAPMRPSAVLLEEDHFILQDINELLLPTTWDEALWKAHEEELLASGIQHQKQQQRPAGARSSLSIGSATSSQVSGSARGSEHLVLSEPVKQEGEEPARLHEEEEDHDVGDLWDGGADYDDHEGGDDSPRQIDSFRTSTILARKEEASAAARRLVDGLDQLPTLVDYPHNEAEKNHDENDDEEGKLLGQQQAEQAAEAWHLLSDITIHEKANPLAMMASGAAGGVQRKDFLIKSTKGAVDGLTKPAARTTKPTVRFDAMLSSSSLVDVSASLAAFRTAPPPSLTLAPTLTKNITPLGKSLLVAADAAQQALAYTQTFFQKEKAELHHLLLPPPLTSAASSSSSQQQQQQLPWFLPTPPLRVKAFFQPFSTANPQWNLLSKERTVVLQPSSTAAGAGNAVASNSHRGSLLVSGGSDPGVSEEQGVADEQLDHSAMPLVSDGGAGEDGGFYDDMFGDDGGDGPEHDDEDGAGGAAAAEALLLDQLRNSYAAQQQRGSTTDGEAPLEQQRLPIQEWEEAIEQTAQPTLVQQMNVALLRQRMWEAIQEEMQMQGMNVPAQQQQQPSADGSTATTQPKRKGGVREEVSVPVTNGMWKSGAARVLSAKRSRDDEPEDEEEDEDEDEEDQLVVPSKKPRKLETTMTASSPSTQAPALFSSVVMRLLPQANEISPASRKLSPAFLFFSLLFVTNEKGVVWHPCPANGDLKLEGMIAR